MLKHFYQQLHAICNHVIDNMSNTINCIAYENLLTVKICLSTGCDILICLLRDYYTQFPTIYITSLKRNPKTYCPLKHIYHHLPPTFFNVWDFVPYSIQAHRHYGSGRVALSQGHRRSADPRLTLRKHPHAIGLVSPLPCATYTHNDLLFSLWLSRWMATSSVYISVIMSFMIIDVFVPHIRTTHLTKQMQIWRKNTDTH